MREVPLYLHHDPALVKESDTLDRFSLGFRLVEGGEG